MARARYRASCRSGPASLLGFRIRSIFRSTVRVLGIEPSRGSVGLRLSGPLHAGLLELARACGASLFMVLSLF